MSWRQFNCALTLLVELLTVTGLWVLVLVAVRISGAFSFMAERRRQETAAKPELASVWTPGNAQGGPFLSNSQ